MGKITYKIDRLISTNNELELGIKTNAKLSVTKNSGNFSIDVEKSTITSTSLLSYPSATIPVTYNTASNAGVNRFKLDSGSIFYDKPNAIPNVDYVNKTSDNIKDLIFAHLNESYLSAGNRIAFDTSNGSPSNPRISISVSPLYTTQDSWETNSGISKETVDSEVVTTIGSLSDAANGFITGIKVDKYGKVIEIKRKQVSTESISGDLELDNYRKWAVTAGAGDSVQYVLSAFAQKTDTNPTGKPNIKFSATSPLVATIDTTADSTSAGSVQIPQITYALNYSDDSFAVDNAYFKLKTFNNVTVSTAAILKVTVDEYGRITTQEAATASDITPLVSSFSASQAGKVTPKGNDNIDSAPKTDTTAAASGGPTYFLTHEGKWAALPLGKVQVTAVSSGTTARPLLASSDAVSGTANHTAVANSSVYLTDGGNLYATAFYGSGSNLTNIDVNSLYGGSGGTNKIDASLINIDGNISNKTNLVTELGFSSIRDSNTSGKYKANSVITANDTGTLTPVGGSNTVVTGATASDGGGTAILSASYSNASTNTRTISGIHWHNLKDLVSTVVAGEGGMRFKGVIGDGTNGTVTWESIETSEFQKGDFYKIGSLVTTGSPAPDYAGYSSVLEVGDTIFAVANKDSNYSGNAKANYWTVIQGNLKDALTMTTDANTGSTDATTGNTYAATLVDSTHKSQAYTGFTVTKGSDNLYTLANTIATKAGALTNNLTIWGNSIDGSEGHRTIGSGAGISGVGTITPHASNTYTLGTSEAIWTDAWITNVHGNATTATTADKVANKLKIYLGSSSATPIEYDGSPANNGQDDPDTSTKVVISIDKMHLFDNVENAAVTGEGNVITGVSLSRKNASDDSDDHSVLVCTVTKNITALTELTSNIFSISGTGASRAISFRSISGAGYPTDGNSNAILSFYTGGSDPAVAYNSASILKLYGILRAVGFEAYDGTTMRKVVLEKASTNTTSAYDRKILVSTNTGNSDPYSFIASSVSMAPSSTGITDSDVLLPTSKSVKAYVDAQTGAQFAESKVEVLSIPFTAVDTYWATNDNRKIPGGSVVDHIDVYIGTPFSTNIQFDLTEDSTTAFGTSGTKIISSSDSGSPLNLIDIESAGAFSYKFSQPISGGFRPKVTISGTSNVTGNVVGSGTVYVYYTRSPRAYTGN